jgi:Tfp pilus assembly protein PilO
MADNKRMGPKQEIGLAGGVMVLAIIGWYFLLYQPIVAKTETVQAQLSSQEDSVKADQNYKIKTAQLQLQISELNTKIATWDARFPARTEIVSLAKEILHFGEKYNLELIEMRPSLFELYALEKAGAHVSGRYTMQLPISCHFQGRYLDLGQMLDEVSKLPFNATVADVALSPIPKRYPELDIKLRIFLYVHL